jgi:hypothetical protein
MRAAKPLERSEEERATSRAAAGEPIEAAEAEAPKARATSTSVLESCMLRQAKGVGWRCVGKVRASEDVG